MAGTAGAKEVSRGREKVDFSYQVRMERQDLELIRHGVLAIGAVVAQTKCRGPLEWTAALVLKTLHTPISITLLSNHFSFLDVNFLLLCPLFVPPVRLESMRRYYCWLAPQLCRTTSFPDKKVPRLIVIVWFRFGLSGQSRNSLRCHSTVLDIRKTALAA